LSRAKLSYTEIEKIAYAILIPSRKLKHYFQALEITVPLAQPLGHIFSSKEASGRIGKWATELSLFSINYVAIIAIKSQALADFMADWTPSSQSNSQPPTQVWTLYTDGALGHLGAGASAVLISPFGNRSVCSQVNIQGNKKHSKA
jgi:hypothetical protein